MNLSRSLCLRSVLKGRILERIRSVHLRMLLHVTCFFLLELIHPTTEGAHSRTRSLESRFFKTAQGEQLSHELVDLSL